jgi:signal transduction histidine kinase
MFGHLPVKIVKRYDPVKGMSIDADPYQLREIFSNILNNAYQAVSGKEGHIEIGASTKRSGYVSIYVKDNGGGIGEEDLKKVFNAFFTRRSRGTGLGLTVCKELVELHGGGIDIKSAAGSGTTVYVKLPKKKKH